MYVENLNYLNINSLRSYPIREGLSGTDSTGIFTLPNDFIVDIQVAASSDVTRDFYISQVIYNVSNFIIQISDDLNSVVGTFTIPTAVFTLNSDYLLQTVPGPYAAAQGRITIGSLSSITSNPSGIFVFPITSTQLEPRTIILSVSGINSITFLDAENTSQTLNGNIQIVARNNLRFSYDDVNNYLILDAGDGLGLNTTCTLPVCVQTINGVKPDPSTGNISFIGVGCSGITTTTAATLQINDTCCTPCSGCDDLATLTNEVQLLESRYLDLKNYFTYLQSELAVYLATVNSAGCSCD